MDICTRYINICEVLSKFVGEDFQKMIISREDLMFQQIPCQDDATYIFQVTRRDDPSKTWQVKMSSLDGPRRYPDMPMAVAKFAADMEDYAKVEKLIRKADRAE